MPQTKYRHKHRAVKRNRRSINSPENDERQTENRLSREKDGRNTNTNKTQKIKIKMGRKIKHTKSGETQKTDERLTTKCERETVSREQARERERSGRTLKHKHKHQIVWWDRKKEREKGVRVGFSSAVTKTTEENKLCKEEIPMFENFAILKGLCHQFRSF